MTQKILIVDDEPNIVMSLEFLLKKEGFQIDTAGDGDAALDKVKSFGPDLVLLDVMMPKKSGFEVCEILRADASFSNLPIIMLTAKSEEIDRILGLELGADDYVVKPFSVRELMLRVKAVLRRGGRTAESPVLERHGIRVRTEAHSAEVGGEMLNLTATEFRLLEDLLRHAGSVRTREQLLNNVWGYSFEGYARTVDTHVRRLRAKLGDAAPMLETVRGVGYRIKE